MLQPLALLACLTLGSLEEAQSPRYVIRSWRSEDGLPQNHVTCVAWSRQGYLWVGTSVGLARFDGVRFRTFDLHDGLRTGRVLVLYEDRRGTLWVGLGGGGLARFERGRFVSLSTREGLPSDTVSTIAEDHQGRLWIGTNKGLAIWDGSRLSQADGVDQFNGRSIESILVTRNGAVNVAAFLVGLFTFEYGKWSETVDGKRLGLQRACSALMEDRSGRLWAGTDHETVLRRDPEGWTECRVRLEKSLTYVQRIVEDAQGVVWCVLPHGELNYFRPGRSTAETFELLEGTPQITCILPDPGGGIWVGTRSTGLHRLSPPRVRSLGQKEGLAARTVQTVGEPSPGVLWVGTWGAGLYEFDSGKFRNVIPLNLEPDTTYINVIMAAKDGSCWVGMGNGLHQFRDGKRIAGDEFAKIFQGDSVLAMIEDRKQGLWVGTSQGHVWRIIDSVVKKVEIRTGGQAILSLAQTGDGVLWIGTRGGGLYRYQRDSTARIRAQSSVASEEIGALLVDPDNTLWIGTVGGGLGRYKEGQLVFFTKLEGMSDDTVHQIIDDNHGHIWTGTNRGISQLSKAHLEEMVAGARSRLYPLTLNQSDGLPSDECADGPPARLHSGELAFPTLNGLVLVNPAVAFPPDAPARAVIEEVVVNGRTRDLRSSSPDAEFVLSAHERRLEFRYTNLLGPDCEKSRFRVKLSGLDPEWVDVGTERSAIYSYLPSGRYQFRVTTCNPRGEWLESAALLSLRVEPYYWETWLFQACVIFIAALGLVTLVRFYLHRRYLHQLAELERQHDLERERARIARDIHDDLGASLTQIGFWSALATEEMASPAEIREQAVKIHDRSLELVRSLDATVWAINPKNDTVSSLVTYLCQYADEFLADSSVRCRKDIVAELPHASLSADRRHHLFLAAKEALNNVAKHSASTEVWLRVKREKPGILTIVIEDHGNGCDLETLSGVGNGVENMRRRMNEVGGACEIISTSGAGTRVMLQLPIEDTSA